MNEVKTAISVMDTITIIFSFVTMILVIINFFRSKKLLDRIEIVFYDMEHKREITIDRNLTRKDCTRSEVQGVLRTKLAGMHNQYKIAYLAQDAYFENIYDIQKGRSDKLVILLREKELAQFGLDDDLH